MRLFYFFAMSVLISIQAGAYFDIQSKKDLTHEMNGIDFLKYKDFVKKWHLVTVRYRKDSNEMRFVYANDLAWNSMNKLKPHYPEGAVFAKIGLTSEVDPVFPSSVVPSGAKRYQFMVKDSAKYKESDGWGYALFTGNGKIFDEALKPNMMACVACHRIVPTRDFVFSRQASLDFNSINPDNKSELLERKLSFTVLNRNDIPKKMDELLPKDTKNIDSLDGPLKKFAFSGTLDEVIPLLIEQTKLNQRPSALIANSETFSLVRPNDGTCHPPSASYLISVYLNGAPVRSTEVCQ